MVSLLPSTGALLATLISLQWRDWQHVPAILLCWPSMVQVAELGEMIVPPWERWLAEAVWNLLQNVKLACIPGTMSRTRRAHSLHSLTAMLWTLQRYVLVTGFVSKKKEPLIAHTSGHISYFQRWRGSQCNWYLFSTTQDSARKPEDSCRNCSSVIEIILFVCNK